MLLCVPYLLALAFGVLPLWPGKGPSSEVPTLQVLCCGWVNTQGFCAEMN